MCRSLPGSRIATIGGSGSDLLIGNDAANVLKGGAGNEASSTAASARTSCGVAREPDHLRLRRYRRVLRGGAGYPARLRPAARTRSTCPGWTPSSTAGWCCNTSTPSPARPAGDPVLRRGEQGQQL
ncbi:hypothetical protein ACPA9J_14205 [Pseudomonas aeruginosa]